MNISSIQEQILKLKKEKDVCILAHSYQAHEFLKLQITQATATS